MVPGGTAERVTILMTDRAARSRKPELYDDLFRRSLLCVEFSGEKNTRKNRLNHLGPGNVVRASLWIR